MIRPIESLIIQQADRTNNRLVEKPYVRLFDGMCFQTTDCLTSQTASHLNDKTAGWSIIKTFKRSADRMNDHTDSCTVCQSANQVNNQPNV